VAEIGIGGENGADGLGVSWIKMSVGQKLKLG
jgi:hypothetical protein